MAEQTASSTDVASSIAGDRRRLAIAHACLAVVAVFSYYALPTSWHPNHLAGEFLGGFGAFGPALALFTAIAWIPYLISWRVSIAVLPGSRRAVSLFIIIATVATVAAIPIYHYDLFELPRFPSVMIAAALAVVLTISAFLIGSVARRL